MGDPIDEAELGAAHYDQEVRVASRDRIPPDEGAEEDDAHDLGMTLGDGARRGLGGPPRSLPVKPCDAGRTG